ncbi:MAG: FadR/GntR family transcriptional regulator [Desulforegulaceae bacterium]|nr:FadR/GntR family transcriptional regulator [Desulforegulaceae bacterium]
MKLKRYEKIAADIEEQISSSKLMPGDKISSERRLASHYNVSRNTVREAIKTLVEKNVLLTRPGSGNFVSENAAQIISRILEKSVKNSKKRLKEIIELRKIIEPGIAFLAAEKINEKQIIELEKIIKDQKEAVNSKTTYSKLDENFHKIIAKASSNSVLLSLYEKLGNIIAETRGEELITPERIKNSIILHKNILEALKNKDSKKVWALMAEHLEEIEESIKK